MEMEGNYPRPTAGKPKSIPDSWSCGEHRFVDWIVIVMMFSGFALAIYLASTGQ